MIFLFCINHTNSKKERHGYMNPYQTQYVDLHVHSDKSDGSYSPSDLVSYAIQKGLTAFALTDHDTVDGIDEAIKAAQNTSVTVIPGIELSTEYQGKDIHIVGLMIDKEEPDFRNKIQEFVDSRILRNQKMCQKLTEHGAPVTYEELMDTFPGAVITRAHFSRILLEKGYVKSLKEAFERYVGDHAPCFLPREKITPEDAVKLILSAKGIPVLAHPLQYGMGKERLQILIDRLKEAGLQALEAIYCTYTPSEENQMRALALANHLLISGGSDFHGTAKPGLDLGTGYGKLYIPKEVLDTLMIRKKELFS